MKKVMRTNRTKIVVVVLLMFLMGCSSNYKSFKLSNVDEGEGTIIGKIQVVLNGEDYSNLCYVCINSSCQNLTLEGYVFMPMKQGTAQIEKVYCETGVSESKQVLQGAQFEVKPGVTYFGDVTLDWKKDRSSSGGAKFMSAAFGLIGRTLAQGVETGVDGEIKMSVKDDMSSVLKTFREQMGKNDIQAEKSIVSVGVQAER